MAVMEVFCFLRFGGAFDTLGTAVVMTALCKRSRAGRGKAGLICMKVIIFVLGRAA